jgi:hypothetical protein
MIRQPNGRLAALSFVKLKNILINALLTFFIEIVIIVNIKEKGVFL